MTRRRRDSLSEIPQPQLRTLRGGVGGGGRCGAIDVQRSVQRPSPAEFSPRICSVEESPARVCATPNARAAAVRIGLRDCTAAEWTNASSVLPLLQLLVKPFHPPHRVVVDACV
eukprot:GHVU01214086.1.p1 GENE.GHVU01214086.1~~GHVU01214086.1.p1  ORF type:complete len:114 (+),score=5.20 GHVU01214086.1:292-633(+)